MKRVVTLTMVFVFMSTVIGQHSENKYSIRLLGKEVNNKYSNFGTSYYGDKVVFSSPKKRNYVINNIWKPNEQPYLDLHVGQVSEEGDLHSVKKFSNQLTTKYHEAQVCFTNDLKRVYFTRNNYYKGKYTADTLGVNRLQMYTAEVDSQGKWSNIQPMPFNNKDYSVGHPTLSSDEKTLYFVSDQPGGFGATDIYKVSVLGNNQYGTPQNLGSSINTEGREMFPYISKDELYYSSDGRSEGKGGLDVYVSKIEADGSYGESKNLVNLNSPKDDFGFIINDERRDGYFSSNREGGFGDDDIYYFNELEREKPVVLKCTYVFLVKDKTSGAILPKSTVIVHKGNEILSQGLTNDKGEYTYTGDCVEGAIYKAEASNKPVYSSSSVMTKAYDKDNLTQNYELLLAQEFKQERGKIVVKINPIYFDYDKSFIRDDARVELEKVVRIMQKYPKIRIEAGSHTDSRGRNSYNQRLSERRAKSTVDYITSQGISVDRITYRGYGETQLVNRCRNGVKCSKAEHQLNRRTEFVIVNPEVLE